MIAVILKLCVIYMQDTNKIYIKMSLRDDIQHYERCHRNIKHVYALITLEDPV